MSVKRRRRRGGVVSAAVALAVLMAGAAACTPKKLSSLPPPPTTQPRPPTTPPEDLSGVDLKGVTGKTTTTVVMGPGRTTLQGVVVGPDGPVPGATVMAERLVGDGAAVAKVVTNPDGTWALPAVLGGRFRVRAWRATDLALTKPEVFFVNDGDTKQLRLGLTRYTGLAATHALAPSPAIVGQPANLVVQVVQQAVDENGIVRGTPVPNVRAELVGGGGEWSVLTANPSATDGQGRATWQVRCRSAGKHTLAVVVAATEQFPLDLPPCVEEAQPPPPTTETTTTSSSTSTTSGSTTSTTRR